VLVVGFAMFTIQIFAEILKRIAAISGRPIDSNETGDHGI
jgi:TRAP-type mannitol/chloroaromatic compound transport system permease small subunit